MNTAERPLFLSSCTKDFSTAQNTQALSQLQTFSFVAFRWID